MLKSELIKPYLSNELKHLSENISKKEDVTNMHIMLINNIDFRNAVSSAFDQLQSSHSEHAKYWISYMVMVEILFLNHHALRSKQWNEYLSSLRLMLPWMIIYDNEHYSRYLTLYWARMKSLNKADTKWMAYGHFSFSLTGRPYSSIPPDQTIEMCMNKESKIKGGWIGITKNLSMMNTNSQTVNKIATIKDTLMEFSKRKKNEVGHRENASSRKLIDEKAVQDMDSCITEWECDPWDLSKCIV